MIKPSQSDDLAGTRMWYDQACTYKKSVHTCMPLGVDCGGLVKGEDS